jgi:hypothetical protein
MGGLLVCSTGGLISVRAAPTGRAFGEHRATQTRAQYACCVRWRSADLIDGGLPRSAIGSGYRSEVRVVDILTVNGTSLLVYQPQVIDWTNHQTQTTGEAIAISKAGEKTPSWLHRDLV